MNSEEAQQGDRQEGDVEAEHLTIIKDVEEPAEPNRVDSILPLQRDPLAVEVLLAQVPGEGRRDRDDEHAEADQPRPSPAVAPARHEILAQQVQDHRDEEYLDAPVVDRVHEFACARLVPPGRPEEHQQQAAADDPEERRDGTHAEHVDPRGHVARHPVGQHLRPRPAVCDRVANLPRPVRRRGGVGPLGHRLGLHRPVLGERR